MSKRRLIQYKTKPAGIFFGLGKNAANIASQGDMGWTSCNMKQKIESCRLYFKIQCTDDNRLVKKVFRWSSTHGKSWESRFKNFLSKNDLQDLLTKDCSITKKVACAKEKLKITDVKLLES